MKDIILTIIAFYIIIYLSIITIKIQKKMFKKFNKSSLWYLSGNNILDKHWYKGFLIDKDSIDFIEFEKERKDFVKLFIKLSILFIVIIILSMYEL